MELRICDDCGTPYLKAMQDFGVRHRMILGEHTTEDDFSTDVEPDPDAADQGVTAADLWVAIAAGTGRPAWVHCDTLDIQSDPPADPADYLPLPTIDAHDEAETVGTARAAVAPSMINHSALVAGSADVTARGICTGGTNKGTLKRNVHFVHDRLTDVYEMQLPKSASEAAAFALAAALREALTQWLGIEAAEVGIVLAAW